MRPLPLLPPRREVGASAAEYAVLVAGIAALLVLSLYAFGGAVLEMFNDSAGCLDPPTSASCDTD